MLTYNEDSDIGIAEITVGGHVTTPEFDAVASKLEALIAAHGKVRVLEIIEDFQGMDAEAFWHDLKFSIRHLSDFSRCAVVCDKKWVSVWTEIVGPFIRCDVEHFEPGEIEAARAWLAWPEGSAD